MPLVLSAGLSSYTQHNRMRMSALVTSFHHKFTRICVYLLCECCVTIILHWLWLIYFIILFYLFTICCEMDNRERQKKKKQNCAICVAFFLGFHWILHFLFLSAVCTLHIVQILKFCWLINKKNDVCVSISFDCIPILLFYHYMQRYKSCFSFV